MKMEHKELWQRCVDFHGHECGGLAVGFQASVYAMELLGATDRAGDEELVCITENDACGVDAIQALLGCTVGKGNLIFRMRGKQAFSFYNRANGKSVRLFLRATPDKTRDERLEWLMDGDYHEMFDVKDAAQLLPETARIFKTYACAKCGERMAESHTRLQKGEFLCEDCWSEYTRGL